ncbi:MAG: class IIb bacteriocin, lactobin A/cerein 7B family [Thermoanaerobacteraceae bacterium]|nr:class IIb bacteriocin, lactobin A/cerein 7B family [Thermoanaerobacteraceae bacterium]
MEPMNVIGFNEISENELYDINGGIAPLVIAGIIVGGAFVIGLGIGAYVGYKEAERADRK